ncbi:hypothetical protein [Methyloceanibacter sp.]|uniref:hypothetical protein n=1 Tax=Methyloceanibacter sp. TaxID=1965321 RepID=UPI003D6D53C0
MKPQESEAPCRGSGEGAGTSITALASASVPQHVANLQARTRLRLPPYGRKLHGLRREGLAPNIAVLILDGWARTANLDEYAPWVLVVPDNVPADCFDFRCIAGLFAFVVAERIARADDIALQVFRYSPKGVYSWTDELGVNVG